MKVVLEKIHDLDSTNASSNTSTNEGAVLLVHNQKRANKT